MHTALLNRSAIDNYSHHNLLIDYHLLDKAVVTLQAIKHSLRRQILKLLNEEKQLTVTEIYIKLRIEQSIASQHLAALRKAGVVKTKRDGKFIFYSLNAERIAEIKDLVRDLAKEN